MEPFATDKVDAVLENRLRPKTFADFPGQKQIKENLQIYIAAAKQRGEPLDHILFSGPPGLGKTTLAGIISNAMNTEMRVTSGPALERPADLAGLLTSLKPGEILFIDEIHRLSAVVEEYLYSAMEDWAIDVVMESGLCAKSVHLALPHFCLIGATTREGLLTAPFRARFGIQERLDYYEPQFLEIILRRSAAVMQVELSPDGAEELAKRSRGTPRIANRFLARVRDVAQVKGNGVITREIARQGLKMLGVDDRGLTEMDRRYLECLYKHNGAPVGLKTLAMSIGEEDDTLENVYEPYLIREHFVIKTPQGRKITPVGGTALGRELPAELFG